MFRRIDMDADVFGARAFTRLEQLQYLLRTRQIDDRFFWTDRASADGRQDSGL